MTGSDALTDLDARLLKAHEAGDPEVLSELYTEAANAVAVHGAADQAAFLFTQALVFALEAGTAGAAELAARLRAAGRHD